MALQVNGLFPGELNPTTTVAGCIDIFENAWPNYKETIESLEQVCADSNSNVYWMRAGTVGNGPRQDARTNKVLELTHLADITNNPILQKIHNQFNLLLLGATNPYAQRYKIGESFWHEGYQVLKYSGGEEYTVHYDGATSMGRAVSAIVYLNDDYEGGHLEFPNFNIKIKPQPGMLILFPSNYAYSHASRPVTSGTKYAIVTWIKDRQV